MNLILFLLSYFVFVALSIPIHELGHLFFGLITGYSFSSFRLLSFVWVKERGKIIFKKTKSFLIGQCLMVPSKDESKFKFVWYNIGGGIFNLIIALVMYIAFISFINNANLKTIFFAGIIANIVIGFMNLIPMNFNIPNDGMNVLMALQSKEARHGFFLLLLLNSETVEGKRYRDFNSEMFSIKESANFNNYFVACIVMSEAARLYDIGKYDTSIEQYNRLNVDKLQTYYRNLINLDLLYYYTVHKPDFEKAKKIYEDKRMKACFKLKLPSVTRVLSAYEYFVNNDKEKGMLLLEKAKMDIENYPNIGIKNMEKDYCLELEKLY